MQGDMEGRVIEESGSDSDSDSENNWECDVADNPIYFDGIKPKLEGEFCDADENQNCSRAEYLAGKDSQGIDWEMHRQTRDSIRASRLANYDNYLNLPEEYNANFEEIQSHAGDVAMDGKFYDFQSYKRDAKHSIIHFQLRNLLWATSAFEYYFHSQNTIRRYNSLSKTSEEVLRLQGRLQPVSPTVGNVLVSTLNVCHELIAVGGFYGEIVVQRINGPIIFGETVSSTDSGITNGLEVFQPASGPLKLIASNNDNLIRMFDVEDFRQRRYFPVPWPANWTTASPDGGRLLAVVGDDPCCLILDSNSGEKVAELKGHVDYSFAAAWHPSGTQLATGNQDTTTRIWDLRMPRDSLHVLVGQMAAVRSLRYSPDGRFLAAAEAADFVHIYDSKSDYAREQELEMFSEICGVAFTPDDSGLMISLQEESYGGFMLYNRNYSTYADHLV